MDLDRVSGGPEARGVILGCLPDTFGVLYETNGLQTMTFRTRTPDSFLNRGFALRDNPAGGHGKRPDRGLMVPQTARFRSVVS
jgi:hypothetical protein